MVAPPSNIILSTAYLPPIQSFAWLVECNTLLIEQHENYVKQTYRNRCTILSANGPINLTIPTIKRSGEKVSIREVEIEYVTPWQKNHWKALESAYQNSPYFEHIADDLIPLYNKKTKYLFDLNQSLMEVILSFLEIKPSIELTQNYNTNYPDTMLDLRESISPKVDPHEDNVFSPKPYYQVFRHKGAFVPNLSIIDLVCNEGLLSLEILEDSIKKDAHQR